MGFDGKTIKNVYKKGDEYPNDYYIVWGEKNVSIIEFENDTLIRSRFNYSVNDSSIVGCDTGTKPEKNHYIMSYNGTGSSFSVIKYRNSIFLEEVNMDFGS